MATKKCTKCGESKPLIEFNKNRQYYQGKCKICQVEYNKEKYKTEEKWKVQRKKGVKKCSTKTQAVYGIFDNDTCLYVGQSSWYESRKYQHKTLINDKNSWQNSPQNYLYPLIRQHSNVDVRIIEECLPEILLEREQYYIDNYKPLYNIQHNND
jgi:hypothetical protein